MIRQAARNKVAAVSVGILASVSFMSLTKRGNGMEVDIQLAEMSVLRPNPGHSICSHRHPRAAIGASSIYDN